MSTLGSRIAAARIANHLSRAWVAKQLGVDRTTVFRWENGSIKIPTEKLIAYAGLLDGVDRTALVFGKPRRRLTSDKRAGARS